MQASLEYDFVFICNEHMPIDRTETSMMCQFYAANGISPIVRVPVPEPHYIAMALDAGAQGIVVPYVETEEQVRQAVGAVRYRPVKGRKLEQYLAGEEPTRRMAEFFERFNRETYLIIGIESVAAYESLDRLISIPGVDGVFVGPHDMTVSMEIPEKYDNPDFVGMLDDIIRRCRKANIGIGVHLSQMVTPDAQFKRLIDKGMNWVLYGADVALLVGEMRKRLQDFRTHKADSYSRAGGKGSGAASCIVGGSPGRKRLGKPRHPVRQSDA